MKVDNRHWLNDEFTQRMTNAEWRTILLNGDDRIIYKGNIVPLKAKKLGYGVVEVSKVLVNAEDAEHAGEHATANASDPVPILADGTRFGNEDITLTHPDEAGSGECLWRDGRWQSMFVSAYTTRFHPLRECSAKHEHDQNIGVAAFDLEHKGGPAVSIGVYEILTAEFGTDGYTAQPGCPRIVVGFAGLRRALRILRGMSYDARRGDWAVKVERINEEARP